MYEDPDQLRYELLDRITPDSPPEEVHELAARVSRGDYEIYMGKIDAILDEAHEVFTRTGVSSMLKSGDVVVGLHNRRGDLVSASCGTYLHGPIAQLPVKYLVDTHLEGDSNVTVNPGDIFYTNEALTGGIHNPDQMAIMPIFHDDELIGWATSALHQPESGAIEPGGMPETARTRYDEGMRLTPIKIAEEGEIRDDLMDMMCNFILRAPDMQSTDVKARCTTVNVIRERVREMAADTGPDFVKGLFQRAIEVAETGARNYISGLNDGVYRSVGFFDNIGAEEALMKISLELEKEDDRLHFDFSGTSPEAGAYNSFAHAVPAFIASYLFPYVFDDLPVSTGAFSPFSFEVPDRSVLNANPEASVAKNVLVGTVVLSLAHDTFARLLYPTNPEDVAAPPDTQEGGVAVVGTNKFGVQEANTGSFGMNTKGGGARVSKDGINAMGFTYAPWGKSRNIEEMEESGILLTLTARHLQNSGGAGRQRGGNGTQAIHAVVSEEPVVSGAGGKGARIPNNTGLFGGYAESSLMAISIRDTDVLERLDRGDPVPKDVFELLRERSLDGEYELGQLGQVREQYETGDVLVELAGGGGGLGDPIERDPEAVLEDVKHGMITEWEARNVYAVSIEEGRLDRSGTERLREQTRRERLNRGQPYEDFIESWESERPPDEILEYYGPWPEEHARAG